MRDISDALLTEAADRMDELRLQRDKLAESLQEVGAAALRQLAFMGKGREPSPKLQEAIASANAALQFANKPPIAKPEL